GLIAIAHVADVAAAAPERVRLRVHAAAAALGELVRAHALAALACPKPDADRPHAGARSAVSVIDADVDAAHARSARRLSPLTLASARAARRAGPARVHAVAAVVRVDGHVHALAAAELVIGPRASGRAHAGDARGARVAHLAAGAA